VPMGKVSLEAGAQTTAGAGSTTSVAAAAYDTMARAGEVASTANDVGNESEGAVVSATVTTKLALALFPAVSVALHATVVEPSGNTLPDVGLHVQIGLGSRSTTLTLYTTAAPSGTGRLGRDGHREVDRRRSRVAFDGHGSRCGTAVARRRAGERRSAVSVVMDVGSQPVVVIDEGDWASVTLHVTVTSLVYQPLFPSAPSM